MMILCLKMLIIAMVLWCFSFGSKCCSFQQSCEENSSDLPCLIFCWHDTSDIHLERTSYVLANMIYPVLLETVIKGTSMSAVSHIGLLASSLHEFFYCPSWILVLTTFMVNVRLKCAICLLKFLFDYVFPFFFGTDLFDSLGCQYNDLYVYLSIKIEGWAFAS